MYFQVRSFSPLWAVLEPKGAQKGGFGRYFGVYFRGRAKRGKSMFYVGASSILKVQGGLKIDEI